jgi:MFS family permease
VRSFSRGRRAATGGVGFLAYQHSGARPRLWHGSCRTLFLAERSNPTETGWWRLAFVLAPPLGLPTLSISALMLLVAAAAVALGRLSDVVGRRPVAMLSTVALAALAAPMSVVAGTSRLGLLLAQTVIGGAMVGVLLVAMVGELFPTRLRSTGMAMTAGLASALIGGTAPVIDQILVTTLGLDIAPGLYVSFVACLALVALWRWPETAFKPTS